MRNLRPLLKIILIIGVSAWLAACGGGGSNPATNTDCVIGTSTIGDCKIQ